ELERDRCQLRGRFFDRLLHELTANWVVFGQEGTLDMRGEIADNSATLEGAANLEIISVFA
ncbi:hypothetical protein, partial [Burkholderia sp. Bp9012]|uniref:hypothetical protein n=1 Tax=Burkholderia sp. Bp9012 TaxID=2184562 RepID=UPI001C896F6E